jgi:pimeloyl-ACP methyl ester carboxylesterase
MRGTHEKGSLMRGPLRVLFCHGLESGPGGFKVSEMRRQGLNVTAPDMAMSLWDPRKANSISRSLLAPSVLFQWPWRWISAAFDKSFESCIAVHRRCLLCDGPFDVLVGSSWGGAVAAALVAEGMWTGPTLLLCPALHTKERWSGESRSSWSSADAIIVKLACLSAERKEDLLLIHGSADKTVPAEDSRAISAQTGIRLVMVDGGSHGLSNIVADGRLVQFVHQVAARNSW